MSRSQFFLVEACLVLAGLALLVILFGVPFTGGGGEAVDAPRGTGVDEVSIDVVGRPSVADGEDDSDDPAEQAGGCAVETGNDFLSANQIVSFYGSPYAADLGILGGLPPDEMVARLREQAGKYDAVNGFKGVQPALHLVSTTAQPESGVGGEYILHVDSGTLQDWADRACDEEMLLFLDIQKGRADLIEEIERIRPFLELPYVHLAIDPEFAMDEGEVPGQTIGGYTAEEINEVQEVLREIVWDNGIPDKMLLVHQFEDGMIERPWDIAAIENVGVVVVMDGFSDPPAKVRQFKKYAQPAEYPGIKLFYSLDQPLMTEEEVAQLYPSVVIYQ